MKLTVVVQIALQQDEFTSLPKPEDIQAWVDAAANRLKLSLVDDQQLTIRIVDEDEILQLNKDFRHKDGLTNVLSFPFESPPGLPDGEQESLLGDVVICAAVVHREASQQQKLDEAHWKHMIVHGTLHLLGYDHQRDDEAVIMESLEIDILNDLGCQNPYQQC